jgi:hypothetical protein
MGASDFCTTVTDVESNRDNFVSSPFILPLSWVRIEVRSQSETEKTFICCPSGVFACFEITWSKMRLWLALIAAAGVGFVRLGEAQSLSESFNATSISQQMMDNVPQCGVSSYILPKLQYK